MSRRQAIRTLLDEHLAIGSVVYALRACVRRIRNGSEPADFILLNAMLDYMIDYPDRWHHPKEDRFLFAPLRERSAEAAELADRLEAQHASGAAMIAELKAKLLAFQESATDALAPFADAVERYATFQWEHMRLEEEELIPLAEQVLTDRDWRRIGRAFADNDDPLVGVRAKEAQDNLVATLLSIAQAKAAPSAP